jgi:hypothetical protein
MALVLYPASFAISVVAAGAGSPFTLFPFLYLVSTAIAIGAAVVVARDGNMAIGSLSALGWLGYAVLGAVLASTFDLVYLGPPLIVALVFVRASLGRVPFRQLAQLRATKAALGTIAGFVAVFLPTRALIQRACSGGACYAASDLSLDWSALGVAADRFVSGFPAAGWRFVDSTTGSVEQGWRVFATNAGATLLAMVVVVFAVSVLRKASRTNKSARTAPEELRIRRWPGFVLVVLWPTAVIAGGAAIAALSAKMQNDQPAIGFGWRDSGFAAVGWAIVISVGLALLISVGRSTRTNRALLVGGLVVLTFALGKTFLVNANLAAEASLDPESIVNNRIAAEVIDFDRTEFGNERRCELIDQFSIVFHDRRLPRDEQLAGVLDWVSRNRYDLPFCDR